MRGLEGLRLQDVASHAGLTPAAVLYYYDNLDDLVLETYRSAIERFCKQREAATELLEDGRDRLRACIASGVASGPEDDLPRLLFEIWPRSLRDPHVAALDGTFQERQVGIYYGILVLGKAQGHFTLTDSPRLIASNFVALEDGHQMDVLAGRSSTAEVIEAITSYARAVTGCPF